MLPKLDAKSRLGSLAIEFGKHEPETLEDKLKKQQNEKLYFFVLFCFFFLFPFPSFFLFYFFISLLFPFFFETPKLNPQSHKFEKEIRKNVK